MRILKIIACLVPVLLLFGWIALSIAARSPTSDHFALAHLGSMNDADGARRVLLGFTNQSKTTVVRLTYCAWETKQGAVPDSRDVQDYCVTGMPLIAPGQSTIFSIPAPPSGTWRATACGFRTGWRLRLRNWRILDCPQWLDHLLPLSTKTGWSVEVPSDWIEP